MSQRPILKKIAKELSKIKDVKAVILYGSFARDDYSPKSDIDLLILTTKDETSLQVQDKIIGLDIKRNIQPTIRTLKELKNTDTGLLQNIFREGMIIYLKEPLDIEARLLLKQRPYLLYTFSINRLAQKEKAKFNRELYERKPKKYSYPGLLQKLGGRKISKGCVLVAYERKKAIEKLFQRYKIRAETIKVWM